MKTEAIENPIPAGPERLFGAGRTILCIGLLLNVSLIAFESMAVATILPVVAGDLGGISGYGWAFSSFMLANIVGTIAAGEGADARGPGLPYLLGLLSFATGLLVAGFATSWVGFVLGRTFQGLGGGALMTTSYLSVRLRFPDALRARMFALLSSAWVVPSLVAPAAAGLIADHASWRLVFLGMLPLLLPAGVLLVPSLRRMKGSGSGRFDLQSLLHALLLAAGTGLLLGGLGRHDWSAFPTLAAGAILSLFAIHRLLPRGFLVAKVGLPAGLTTRCLLGFTFFGVEAFVPLGLTTLRGLSPGSAGFALTAGACAWFAGTWLSARMDDARGGAGRRTRVVLGFSIVVLGASATALSIVIPGVPVAFAMIGWAVCSWGMGLIYSTLSLIILALAPAGQEGKVSSAINLTENLGIALGAGIAGAAVDWSAVLGWSFTTGISLAFLLALLPGLLGVYSGSRSQ